MDKEEIHFPLSVFTIMAHKTDPNQFCLRVKPKEPKETDNQLMMVIHNDPLWFSWKYDILHTPALNRVENNWRVVADVLEIKQKPFVGEESKIDDINERHLKMFFKNRKRSFFSRKIDVCHDIFRQLRDHKISCCDEIVSVIQNKNLPEETVYWIKQADKLESEGGDSSEK